MRILTVGHSTLTVDAFLAVLDAHGVQQIADIRAVPRSARHPHFSQGALAGRLAGASIGYGHFPELGGWRRPRPDSRNTAWRSEGFRGYADHMLTSRFETAVSELLQFAAQQPTAVMCAEAVFWRCHRALLSDALLVRGLNVVHVLSRDVTRAHRLSGFARLVDGKLLYPGLL